MRAALLWLGAAACFSPKYNNPTCGPAGECPPGTTCIEGTCRIPTDDAAIDAPPDVAVDAPPGSVTLVFQQGANGYTQTRDTYVSMGDGTPNNTESQIRWGKDERFGLLAFDGIFGGTAIPAGATILSATLAVLVNNNREGDLYDVDIAWPVTVTYDTFGPQPGVDVDNDLGERIAPIPNQSGMLSFDVKTSVQRWAADPTRNHGWCLHPLASATGDGSIRSSDDLNVANRPKLTVVFYP